MCSCQLLQHLVSPLSLRRLQPDAKLSRGEHCVMTPSLPAHSPLHRPVSLPEALFNFPPDVQRNVGWLPSNDYVEIPRFWFKYVSTGCPSTGSPKVLLDFGSFNVQLFSNVCIFLIIYNEWIIEFECFLTCFYIEEILGERWFPLLIY